MFKWVYRKALRPDSGELMLHATVSRLCSQHAGEGTVGARCALAEMDCNCSGARSLRLVTRPRLTFGCVLTTLICMSLRPVSTGPFLALILEIQCADEVRLRFSASDWSLRRTCAVFKGTKTTLRPSLTNAETLPH